MSEHEFKPKSVVFYTGYDDPPSSAVPLESMIEEIMEADKSGYGMHIHLTDRGWNANTIDLSADIVSEFETLEAAISALHGKVCGPSDTRRERHDE